MATPYSLPNGQANDSPTIIRKRPTTQKENFHPVDLQKLLVERENRKQREEELAKLKEFNDELSQTSILSDSCLDASQDAPPERLDSKLVEVQIFDPNFVHHIFKKEDVKFSWLQPDFGIDDIPGSISSDVLAFHLQTRVQPLCLRRSTNLTMCRYLLYLMAVHDDVDVAELCYNLLLEQTENQLMPFFVSIADLMVILMNYGTVRVCLWPIERAVVYPAPFSGRCFDVFEEAARTEQPDFPKWNLKLVLKLLRAHMKTYPFYTEEEKEGLFFLLLNLSMAKEVSCDWNFIVIIKEILGCILMSYTEEEWKELSYRKVEDLALRCWHNELEPVGIVQRIEMIPLTTLRGIQVQKAAAFFAVQNLLDLNPIYLCGIVTFDEILQMLQNKQLVDYPSDLNVIYSVVMLLSYSVDVDNSEEVDRTKMKQFKTYITEWRHSIRDSTIDLDHRPLVIKDLMTQLCTIWNDLPPIDTVV